ncbi:hypothetical protein [Erythrobacter sp.]|uniref:hypothetical protein n=1 Tax=Erythrobacter sp. TaxID=1042 RepID=UPI001425D32C|nr:hypothetical protein [Erythrobacter sp.]QIQ87328.1 MAG: hypothetical protein G9473_12010 [Erythrobacter sp.]
MKPGHIMARLKTPLMAGRDATGRHEAEASPPRRRSERRARRASLAAHPAFVPLVALWGAALFGLAVLVLPPAATARAALLTGLDALGAMAHFLFAALAAMAGGALAFGIARALSHKAKARSGGPAIVLSARRKMSPDTATQATDPINPREELGSESLDAPLEDMPLGMEAGDWLDEADTLDTAENRAEEAGQAGPQPAAEPDSAPNEAPDSAGTDAGAAAETARRESASAATGELQTTPPSLDLAGFAALPGRNAVWVEGPLPDGLAGPEAAQAATPRAPSPETPTRCAAPSAHGSAALARLRSTPAEDLSLVEMVERLAAALHERQAADATRPRAAGTGSHAGRDAALAEALKALGELAGDRAQTPAGAGEAGELAAALARLHDMRGAA